MPVAAHCQTSEGARRAAAAGVASIEHGWTLDDETLALMRENGVVLVPTDATVEVLALYGWSAADAERIHQRRVARLRRAHEAGIRIVFGTDVMTYDADRDRGELAIDFIDGYAESGMSTLEIVRSMTVHAAALVGLEETHGRIRTGFAADLIATTDNPLTDLETLKRVMFVMKGGVIVKHAATPAAVY